MHAEVAAEPYVVLGTLTPKRRHNGKSRLSAEQFGDPLSQGTQWVEDEAPKLTLLSVHGDGPQPAINLLGKLHKN